MSYRYCLFVPGDSARKMSRAPSSGADALILNIKDTVSRAQTRGSAPCRGVPRTAGWRAPHASRSQ